MSIIIKQFLYLGLPILFIILLYISNFSSVIKLIGIAIMSVAFLVAIMIIEINLAIKRSKNIARKTIIEWIAFLCIVLFMLGFFATLFLEIINIKQIIVFEISELFFLVYMILEVCIITNNRIIKNKEITDVTFNGSCKVVLLFLSSIVLLWFFRGGIFKYVYSELIVLERNILIAFTNLLLLAFCVNSICALSSKNKKNLLAMELFFLSLLLIFNMTISCFIWFDKDVANGLTVVLSGVVGGILTLFGVLWTIRREEQIRKDDEKIKNKPYLMLVQDLNYSEPFLRKIRVTDLEIKNNVLSSFITASEDESVIVVNNSNVKKIFSFERCIVKNSENAICIVKGIEINNTFMKLQKPFLLDKNEKFCLFGKDIWFSTEKEDFTVSIIVADINGNNYSVNFELKTRKESIQRKELGQWVVSVGTVFIINEIGLSSDY